MIDPDILDDWLDAYDVFIIMQQDNATDTDVIDFITQLCFTDDEIKFVLSSKEMTAEMRDYALNDVVAQGRMNGPAVELLPGEYSVGLSVDGYEPKVVTVPPGVRASVSF